MQKKVWQAGSAPAVLDWEEELDRELEFFTEGMDQLKPKTEELGADLGTLLGAKVDFDQFDESKAFGSPTHSRTVFERLEASKIEFDNAAANLKKQISLCFPGKNYDFTNDTLQKLLSDPTLDSDKRKGLLDAAVFYKRKLFFYDFYDILNGLIHKLAVVYNKLGLPAPIDPTSVNAQNYKKCADLYDDICLFISATWRGMQGKDQTDFSQFTNILDMAQLNPLIVEFNKAIDEATAPAAAAGADGGVEPPADPAGGGPAAAGGDGGGATAAAGGNKSELPTDIQMGLAETSISLRSAGAQLKINMFLRCYENRMTKYEDLKRKDDDLIASTPDATNPERIRSNAELVQSEFYKIVLENLWGMQEKMHNLYVLYEDSTTQAKYEKQYTDCCAKALEIMKTFRRAESEMWICLETPTQYFNKNNFYNLQRVNKLMDQFLELCEVPEPPGARPAGGDRGVRPPEDPAGGVRPPADPAGGVRPPEEPAGGVRPPADSAREGGGAERAAGGGGAAAPYTRVGDFLPTDIFFGKPNALVHDDGRRAGQPAVIADFKLRLISSRESLQKAKDKMQSLIDSAVDLSSPEMNQAHYEEISWMFYEKCYELIVTMQERMAPLYEKFAVPTPDENVKRRYTVCTEKSVEVLFELRKMQQVLWSFQSRPGELIDFSEIYQDIVIIPLMEQQRQLCTIPPPSTGPPPDAGGAAVVPQPDAGGPLRMARATRLPSIEQFGGTRGSGVLLLGSKEALVHFKEISKNKNLDFVGEQENYAKLSASGSTATPKQIQEARNTMIRSEFYSKAYTLLFGLQQDFERIYVKRFAIDVSSDIEKKYEEICNIARDILGKLHEFERNLWEYMDTKPEQLTDVYLVYKYTEMIPDLDRIRKLAALEPDPIRPPPAPPAPPDPAAAADAEDPDGTMVFDDDEEGDESELVDPNIEFSQRSRRIPVIELLLDRLFHDDSQFDDPSADYSDFYYNEILSAMYLSFFMHFPNPQNKYNFGNMLYREINAKKNRKTGDTTREVKKSAFMETDFYVNGQLDNVYLRFVDYFNSDVFAHMNKDLLNVQGLPKKNFFENNPAALETLQDQLVSYLEFFVATVQDNPRDLDVFGLTHDPNPDQPSNFFQEVVRMLNVVFRAYTQYRQGAVFDTGSNTVKWVEAKVPNAIEEQQDYMDLDMIFPSITKTTQLKLAKLIYSMFYRDDVRRTFKHSEEVAEYEPFSDVKTCLEVLKTFSFYTCNENIEDPDEVQLVLLDINQCIRDHVRDFVKKTTASYQDMRENLQKIERLYEMSFGEKFYDDVSRKIDTIDRIFKLVDTTVSSSDLFTQANMQRSMSQITSLVKFLLNDKITDENKLKMFKNTMTSDMRTLCELLQLTSNMLYKLFRPTENSPARQPVYLHLMHTVMPAMQENLSNNPELSVVQKYELQKYYKILRTLKGKYDNASLLTTDFDQRLHHLGLFAEFSMDDTLVYFCKLMHHASKNKDLNRYIERIKNHEFSRRSTSTVQITDVENILKLPRLHGEIFEKCMYEFHNMPDADLASPAKVFGTDAEVSLEMLQRARTRYQNKNLDFDSSDHRIDMVVRAVSDRAAAVVAAHRYDVVELDFLLKAPGVDSAGVDAARLQFFNSLKIVCIDRKDISTALNGDNDWIVFVYCMQRAYARMDGVFDFVMGIMDVLNQNVRVPDPFNVGMEISKPIWQFFDESTNPGAVDAIRSFRPEGMAPIFDHFQESLVSSQFNLEEDIFLYMSYLFEQKIKILREFKSNENKSKELDKTMSDSSDMIDFFMIFLSHLADDEPDMSSVAVQMANTKLDTNVATIEEKLKKLKKSDASLSAIYQDFFMKQYMRSKRIKMMEHVRKLHMACSDWIDVTDLSWTELDDFLREKGVSDERIQLENKHNEQTSSVLTMDQLDGLFEILKKNLANFEHEPGYVAVLKVFLQGFLIPTQLNDVGHVFDQIKAVMYAAGGDKEFFLPDTPTVESDKAFLLFLCCAALPRSLVTDPPPDESFFLTSDNVFKELLTRNFEELKYVADHDLFRHRPTKDSPWETMAFTDIMVKLAREHKKQKESALGGKEFVLNAEFANMNAELKQLVFGNDLEDIMNKHEKIHELCHSMYQLQLTSDVFSDSSQPISDRLVVFSNYIMTLLVVQHNFLKKLPELTESSKKMDLELERKQEEIDALYEIIKEGLVVRVVSHAAAGGSVAVSDSDSDDDSDSEAGASPAAPSPAPAAPAPGGGAPAVAPAAPAPGGGAPAVAPGVPAAPGPAPAAPAAGGAAAGPTVADLEALRKEVEKQKELVKKAKAKRDEYKADKKALETNKAELERANKELSAAKRRLEKAQKLLDSQKRVLDIRYASAQTAIRLYKTQVARMKAEKAQADLHAVNLTNWGLALRRTAQEQYKVYQKVTEFFGDGYEFGEPARRQTLPAQPAAP